MRAVQGRLCHAISDVVRLCVLSKGDDFMTRSISSDCVCCPRAVMSCHARRCRVFMLSKGADVMPRPTSFDRVFFKGGDGMPRLTSSDRACSPRAVMSCHARRCRPCVQSKGGDVMPRPTLPTVCAVMFLLTPNSVAQTSHACRQAPTQHTY